MIRITADVPTVRYLGDLGVHWASEVLGASLFGGSWLGLSLRLYLALKKRGVLDGRSSEMRVEANSPL